MATAVALVPCSQGSKPCGLIFTFPVSLILESPGAVTGGKECVWGGVECNAAFWQHREPESAQHPECLDASHKLTLTCSWKPEEKSWQVSLGPGLGFFPLSCLTEICAISAAVW